MSLTLRPAAIADRYALWIWANDPDTRAASGNRPPIAWAEHTRWLDDRLNRPDAILSILEGADGLPLGTIRFETTDGWTTARLSYLIAPESRRRGYGRVILGDGMRALRERHPRTTVEALVAAHNCASTRLLRSLGWHEIEESAVSRRFVSRREEVR